MARARRERESLFDSTIRARARLPRPVSPTVWRVRFRHPKGSALLDAVASLRASGLTGWDLVERAQQTVHDRFSDYSCRYWWESPETAFGQRRGYCAQYNGTLASMLGLLGFRCRLVHAFRVSVRDDPSWRMGHVWVQVRHEGQVRDACAGQAANRPGLVGFVPRTRVWPFGPGMRALTTLGMGPLVGFALVRSAVTRRPPPRWLHHPMDESPTP